MLMLQQCHHCHCPQQQLLLLSLEARTPECPRSPTPLVRPTCVLALCVTVPAGHGSSLHLCTQFGTITRSQDSTLCRTQGLCVPPGGVTGFSQAGGGLGLLLAINGCHSIMSVLGPDEAGVWGAHTYP